MRLNKQHRIDILRELTKTPFKKEIAVVHKDQCRLAIAVHKFVLGTDYKRIMRLPREWFTARTSLRVRIAGTWDTLKFNAPEGSSPTIHRPIPYFLLGCTPTIPANHELTQRYKRLNAEEQKIQTEINLLSNGIQEALNKHTTVNGLVKAWPEIEKVVHEVTRAKVQIKVPTTNREAMNSLIGLS